MGTGPSSAAVFPETNGEPANQESVSLSVSLSAHATLQTLAQVAPTLKEAELRIYLHLTAGAAANPPHWTIQLSQSDLVKATRLADSAVRRALQTLTERGLLLTRKGGPHRTAGYKVPALDIVPIGPPLKGGVLPTDRLFEADPPNFDRLQKADQPGFDRLQKADQPGFDRLQKADQPGFDRLQKADRLFEADHLQADRKGEQGNPTRAEQQPARTHTRPPVEIENIDIEKIDRALTSDPKTKDPAALARCRAYIASYYRRHNRTADDVDDHLCAQLLTICDDSLDTLEAQIYRELVDSNTSPGHNNGWLITVAIQRLWHIGYKQQAQIRNWLKDRRAEQRRRPPAQERGGLQSAASSLDSILRGKF